MNKAMKELLDKTSSHHTRLCPRQVIGVRMGMLASELIDVALPQSDKRLMVIVETDGCFANSVAVATGTSVGKRTLRVEDYGKVAAVFVDTQKSIAVRIAPVLDLRERANNYAPEGEPRRYFVQLHGYQIMPLLEMFFAEEVVLHTPIEEIISRPGVRVNCKFCGEEVMNEREVLEGGALLCRACAGQAYYKPAAIQIQASQILA